MQFNPIPYVPDTDSYLLFSIFFSTIAILAITFITGTILALKYYRHRSLTGKIFVAIGIAELIPYIISVIHTILIKLPYLLYNPWMFPFILGCITLTGGVTLLKRLKHYWMFVLIIAAIVVVIWTYCAIFVFGQ